MLFFLMLNSGIGATCTFAERLPKLVRKGPIFQKDLSVGMFFLSSRYFWEKADINQSVNRGRNEAPLGTKSSDCTHFQMTRIRPDE